MTLTAATAIVAVLSAFAVLLVVGLMAAELQATPKLGYGYRKGSDAS